MNWPSLRPRWGSADGPPSRKRHTKQRLALEPLLLLGVRRQDVVSLGRQHRRGNMISFVPKKTNYKRERISEKPILPELADVIARSSTGRALRSS